MMLQQLMEPPFVRNTLAFGISPEVIMVLKCPSLKFALHNTVTTALAITLFTCCLAPEKIGNQFGIYTCILGAILVIRDTSLLARIPKGLFFTWFFWIIVAGVSIPTAINSAYSYKAFRHEVAVPAGLFFLSIMICTTKKHAKICGVGFLLGALVLALTGIKQYFFAISAHNMSFFSGFGIFRPSGTVEWVHSYLQLLIMALPFWIFLVRYSKKSWHKVTSSLALGQVLLGWLLGYGRMQLLIAPLFIFLFPLFEKGKLQQITLVIVSIFILSLGTVFYICQHENIEQKDISPRQHGWKISMNYIQKTPFSGIGYGCESFRRLEKENYMEDTSSANKDIFLNHSHNLFLSIWLTMGLQGVLAWCMLVFAVYKQLLGGLIKVAPGSIERGWIIASLIIITCSLVINMTDIVLTENNLNVFWILIGIATGLTQNKSSDLLVPND